MLASPALVFARNWSLNMQAIFSSATGSAPCAR